MSIECDCDDDQAEPITAAEVIRTHGREYYHHMLSYGYEHRDDRGNAVWTAEEYDRIVGLIDIEGRLS
jgi:hypothetical protein